MARIGTTPGTAQCKRASVAKDTFTGSTRTLYFTELQDITKTTTNEIDKRQRDVVKLSGVKLCIEVNHLQTAPLLVNYAIVYDKRSNDGTTTVNTGDFFRANGGTQRAKDFSTVLSSAEFHCLPLNTDRFTVLWHKRFKLGVNTPSGGYSNNSRENYRMIQKYQKINKLIRYEDGSAQSKIWLMWWCDLFSNPAATPAAANVLQYQHEGIVYFREPK